MPLGTASWHSHLSDDNVTESGRFQTAYITASSKARTMQPNVYFSNLLITSPHKMGSPRTTVKVITEHKNKGTGWPCDTEMFNSNPPIAFVGYSIARYDPLSQGKGPSEH